ncbi:MAG: hypothetical protein EGQ89_03670 [Veillonella magna]|nr:hypothetical protein [Veillonella magna]
MAFLKVTTNLIMYLYYQEHEWQEDIVKQTEKYLSQKDSLENKSIVSALYALVNSNFSRFSEELSHVCKGRKNQDYLVKISSQKNFLSIL